MKIIEIQVYMKHVARRSFRDSVRIPPFGFVYWPLFLMALAFVVALVGVTIDINKQGARFPLIILGWVIVIVLYGFLYWLVKVFRTSQQRSAHVIAIIISVLAAIGSVFNLVRIVRR